MQRERIAIIGSSGHAKIVLDIIEKSYDFEIIGFISKSEKNSFCGHPVLGDDTCLPKIFDNGTKKLVMGVGGFKNNILRKKLYYDAKKIGFEFLPVIDKSTVISQSVKIGEGSVIFPGVIINADAVIGENVIVATASTIDHETIIEDHVLISAGVTVGANTLIKNGALLALGSKIISQVTIGQDVLIGAGAVVVKDCMEQGAYVGIPARIMK